LKYAVRVGTFAKMLALMKKLSKGRLSKPNFAFELEPLSASETQVILQGGRLRPGRGVAIENDVKLHRADDLHRLTILWDTEATTATPKPRRR
jgi:hypothetical protein